MFRYLFELIRGSLFSKTFWVNVFFAALAVLDILGQTDVVKNNPDLALLVVTISNYLTRILTKKPIIEKGRFVRRR